MNLETAQILGAGGYGIVVTQQTSTLKLLYDVNACQDLRAEADIQEASRRVLQNSGVEVPQILSVFTEPVIFQNTTYLCGIDMERFPSPLKTEQVHIVLDGSTDSLNQSWGRTVRHPVSTNNPSRGFFASSATIQYMLEEDGSSRTILDLAHTLGVALRRLLDAGIVPIDLEYVYMGQGRCGLLDFGLCRYGIVDPKKHLLNPRWDGLASELYVPKQGDIGYEAFLHGYFGTQG